VRGQHGCGSSREAVPVWPERSSRVGAAPSTRARARQRRGCRRRAQRPRRRVHNHLHAHTTRPVHHAHLIITALERSLCITRILSSQRLSKHAVRRRSRLHALDMLRGIRSRQALEEMTGPCAALAQCQCRISTSQREPRGPRTSLIPGAQSGSCFGRHLLVIVRLVAHLHRLARRRRRHIRRCTAAMPCWPPLRTSSAAAAAATVSWCAWRSCCPAASTRLRVSDTLYEQATNLSHTGLATAQGRHVHCWLCT
jgi:hypothetical protein